MGAHYAEVNVPAAQAYAWWRGLTNLPSILNDTSQPTNRWTVAGPLGSILGSGARIVKDVPNARIAWVGDNGAGEVRFDDHGSTTGIEVSVEPAEAVPEDAVERAVAAFKQTIEQNA